MARKETEASDERVNVLDILTERKTQLQADGRKRLRTILQKGDKLTKADVAELAAIFEHDDELQTSELVPLCVLAFAEAERLENMVADAGPALAKLSAAKTARSTFELKRARVLQDLEKEEAELTLQLNEAARGLPDTASLRQHGGSVRRRFGFCFDDVPVGGVLQGEWSDLPPAIRSAIGALPTPVFERLRELGQYRPEPIPAEPPIYRPATMVLERTT
jgi:hypothetical protein